MASEIIASTLGKQWRKLGRKLGLSDVKLESISEKHPTDLEETTLELLRVWRNIQKAEARVNTLINALRGCELNLTAEKVEEKLQNMP